MPRPPSPDQRGTPRPLYLAPPGAQATAHPAAVALRIAPALIAWQRHSGRHDLPWQVQDAYRVWLSEIMLQQTQVATVIPYYLAFLARFPDVQALAAAPLEDVMAHWSGLGYYSRARNLHRCAQVVVQSHGGRFPQQVDELAGLPGIGPSTAAAIAVFSFGVRAAILDGNVKRVLARVFALAAGESLQAHERELWTVAHQQLPPADAQAHGRSETDVQAYTHDKPGVQAYTQGTTDLQAYTQGLMDLGASLCSLRRPRCGDCPLQSQCLAARCGLQAVLPSPRKRKAVPTRQAQFELLSDGEQVLLELQPAPGLWGGLWSLPLGEALLPTLPPELAADRAVHTVGGFDHAFTHFKLKAQVQHREVSQALPALLASEPGQTKESVRPRRWMPVTALATAALPRPIKTYLLEAFRERLAASGSAAAPAAAPADRRAASGDA